jgi:2-oxoglutarate dehydrogenase E2 component (dihydrolipoamide succinyltransferase)
MPVEIKVPMLPESVSDAVMLAWHKKEGESVQRDENLVDIETEKVVLEVPAPFDGVLSKIVHGEGDTVTSNDVIALLDDGAAAKPAAAEADARPAPEPAGTAAAETAQPADVKDEAEEDEGDDDAGGQPPMSPAVRRLVGERDLDVAAIRGTGKGGRILKEDVLRHIQEAAAPAEEEQRAPEPAAPAPAEARREPQPPPAPAAGRGERRQPMSRLRQTIASRLVQAQQTAAMLTTFNEVDMGAVMELRKRYRESFEKRHEARLGFMSFFVKASVEALRRFPAVNAYIDGTDIVYHDYQDIGIAVSSPRGLVVPVLRDAAGKSFAAIEREIADFGARAGKGSLSMEELTGGTFTITNGGIFGSLLSTPILNPPQSAILGMHKIQQRPMVVDGAVAARPMMYLALSYDHRIVDGREAVSFLVAVKEALEDPSRILLEV